MMWYSIKNQETKFITIESFSVDEVRTLHNRMDNGEKIHSLLKVDEETSFNQKNHRNYQMILTDLIMFLKGKNALNKKEDEEVYCSNISDFLHGL